MLTSELFENTRRYAPEAYRRLFRSEASEERQAALHQAAQALYMSRAGERLFRGARRHQMLARYIETATGWARLERLADRIYRRSFQAQEQARHRRDLLAQAAQLESERRTLAHQILAAERSLARGQEDRREAQSALREAEARIEAANQASRDHRQAHAELERQIAELKAQLQPGAPGQELAQAG